MIMTHAGDSQSVKSLNLWHPVMEGVAIGAAIGLREDFDGAALRRLARGTKIANQGRRLLAVAEIYDGGKAGSPTERAKHNSFAGQVSTSLSPQSSTGTRLTSPMRSRISAPSVKSYQKICWYTPRL